ncbi:MAG: sulfatase [Pirellulales bacterium]
MKRPLLLRVFATRSILWSILWIGLLTMPISAQDKSSPNNNARRPNFVVLFADDLGYADLHCFGGETMVTPNLDTMARDGRRMTSFYVSQGVCSASRCSLLTGCYNVRLSILGALGPGAKVCLNPQEQTIAEVLKPRGYKTAIYGKWHLGDRGQGLPIHHGFDEYFGLPYSNDMWPFHPTTKTFPDLPLIENDRIVNAKVSDQEQPNLTKWYTEHAVDFIRRNSQSPFFLYVPYSMPHVPIYASEKFKGSTGKGLYHDVIAEIDWSVGEIRKTLRDLKLDDNTLVIFTSDNGPWLSYGNHAGSAGPLREGKGTAWDGGVREPTIACWPGKIPAGSESNQFAATIDVLPTLAHLAGAELPKQPIDGKNIWPLLAGEPGAQTPHESYNFYWGNELHAIRSGDWKLHFPHDYRSLENGGGRDGTPAAYKTLKCGLELYNLADDIGEKKNLIAEHPDVVKRLETLAEKARAELGDGLQKRQGSAVRPAGKLD